MKKGTKIWKTRNVQNGTQKRSKNEEYKKTVGNMETKKT